MTRPLLPHWTLGNTKNSQQLKIQRLTAHPKMGSSCLNNLPLTKEPLKRISRDLQSDLLLLLLCCHQTNCETNLEYMCRQSKVNMETIQYHPLAVFVLIGIKSHNRIEGLGEHALLLLVIKLKLSFICCQSAILSELDLILVQLDSFKIGLNSIGIVFTYSNRIQTTNMSQIISATSSWTWFWNTSSDTRVSTLTQQPKEVFTSFSIVWSPTTSSPIRPSVPPQRSWTSIKYRTSQCNRLNISVTFLVSIFFISNLPDEVIVNIGVFRPCIVNLMFGQVNHT